MGVSTADLRKENPKIDFSSSLQVGAEIFLPPADPYALADRYMKQVDHATGQEYWDESTSSAPPSQLRDALVEYGSTGIGQAMLRGQIHDNFRQKFVLDSTQDHFAYVSDGAIFYNPSPVQSSAGGTVRARFRS